MTISLEALLLTGYFGNVRSGMSKAEVEVLLGVPQATGGTSSKYRQPSLYLYGTVEFWFRQQPPHELTGIWWDAGYKGRFALQPPCIVTDWAITPDWTRPQVEAYLRERNISFASQPSPSPQIVSELRLPSGIIFSFTADENETLEGMRIGS